MIFIVLVAMLILIQAEGFHVNYTITCGKEIIVFSRVKIEILIKCKNGYRKYESKGCETKIPIYDQIPRQEACQMNKFDGQRLYGVTVVACKKIHSQCLNYETKVLTCSYEPHKKVSTWETALVEEYLNFEEIAVENGKWTDLKIVLNLENILGEVVQGPFYIGRKARLVGKIPSKPNIAGILVRNCFATNGKDKMPILIAGCGTGTVFPPYADFVSHNLQVYSPYFTMFQLTPWDKTVSFECTFTVCSTNCNGGSCLKSSSGKQNYSPMKNPNILPHP